MLEWGHSECKSRESPNPVMLQHKLITVCRVSKSCFSATNNVESRQNFLFAHTDQPRVRRQEVRLLHLWAWTGSRGVGVVSQLSLFCLCACLSCGETHPPHASLPTSSISSRPYKVPSIDHGAKSADSHSPALPTTVTHMAGSGPETGVLLCTVTKMGGDSQILICTLKLHDAQSAASTP